MKRKREPLEVGGARPSTSESYRAKNFVTERSGTNGFVAPQ